jgi:hypothetical protein
VKKRGRIVYLYNVIIKVGKMCVEVWRVAAGSQYTDMPLAKW